MSVNVLEQSFCKQKKKNNMYHQIRFPGILRHFCWHLLTHSYSHVHICLSPHVMGVNTFTESFLTWREKKSVISCLKPKWHLQSSTEGYRVCCAVGGVCVCVYFYSPDMKW